MTQAAQRSSIAAADMKRRAKDQFEAWADDYDRSLLNHFLFRPSYITLMEEIARWHGEHRRPFRVLDIGCGADTDPGPSRGGLTHSPLFW